MGAESHSSRLHCCNTAAQRCLLSLTEFSLNSYVSRLNFFQSIRTVFVYRLLWKWENIYEMRCNEFSARFLELLGVSVRSENILVEHENILHTQQKNELWFECSQSKNSGLRHNGVMSATNDDEISVFFHLLVSRLSAICFRLISYNNNNFSFSSAAIILKQVLSPHRSDNEWTAMFFIVRLALNGFPQLFFQSSDASSLNHHHHHRAQSTQFSSRMFLKAKQVRDETERSSARASKE